MNMKKLAIVFFICMISTTVFLLNPVIAQKQISVEDLYKKPLFRPNLVYGIASMNDGIHYTNLSMSRNEIYKYSYSTGEKVETVFSAKKFEINNFDWIFDYEFSSDESKILFSINYEPIYRHSFKAEYYIYDIVSNSISKLSENGKQQLASFSPDGKYVSFVRDNNIFIKDLQKGSEKQLTFDGEKNKIINGAPDWVYEEEFSYNKAYDWSPDSKRIAFLKTDESHVKTYSITIWGNLYPEMYEYKYPKAGEENSKVSLHIIDIENGNTLLADLGDLNDKYIPRLKFTKNPGILSAVKMNRLQNLYELYFIDVQSGNSKTILSLNDEKYIEINDDLTFLNNDKGFILSHEGDGYRHLYYYDFNGKLINQITSGKWEVTEFYGFDDNTETLYFQAAKSSPLRREIYSVKTDGTNFRKISEKEGTNSAEFSKNFKFFINTYSNANTPFVISLFDNSGNLIREIENNSVLNNRIKEQYKFQPKEFFYFTTEDGVQLNGWMIKPKKLKSKNPVLMYVYGGPGSQTVLDSWDRDMAWWQLLAQNGYIIVSVDNRGTGARGKDFRQVTYRELGKYEVLDQIQAAKYLSTLKFVDSKRIGIFGWSYGGYMSTLCMTIGADWFKLGIAVAPVTNWRYYDSIYTERYNGLPQDNPDGYDKNSPINHVKEMKGKYLLIHGTADDNVHIQNAIDLVDKLVASDVDFEHFFYPNKDHGIYGGNTRNHLYRKMTNFILENL